MQAPSDGSVVRRRSQLAQVAALLALVPPAISLLFMGLNTLVDGRWEFVDSLVGMWATISMVCVPVALVLGLVAIVRNLRDPRLTGTWLAVIAVLVTGGEIALAYWFVSAMASGFHGRALRRRGRPVLVAARAVGGSVDAMDGRIAGLSVGDRSALTRHWTRVAREEHTSIAAFERLACALEVHGAPASLIAGAARAARQEADHAARCFALASAFAGRRLVAGAAVKVEDGVPTVAVLAVEALVDGCVGEGTGAAEAAMLLGGTDAAVRATFEVIAVDEAEHAALSWDVLAWCLEVGGAAVHSAALRALARLDGVAAPVTGVARSETQRALGMATPGERAAAWRETVAAVRARVEGLRLARAA